MSVIEEEVVLRVAKLLLVCLLFPDDWSGRVL